MVYQIEIYVDDKGFCPFKYWLSSIGDKFLEKRILMRIERIKEGNFGDHKSISRGIWELRLSYGGGLRIYYGHFNDRIILILVGGNKSSQPKDIKKAQSIWRQYLEANR